MIRIRISDLRSTRIMVDQMNWWIHSGQGFIGSFDLSWSEWSRITDPHPDHIKETHPKTGLEEIEISTWRVHIFPNLVLPIAYQLRGQKQVQARWYTQGLNIRHYNMADGLLQLGFTLSRFTLVNSVSVHGRKGSFPFLASSSFVLAFVLLVWASSNPPGNFASQGNRSNVGFHCREISPYVRTRVNVTPLNETETMYGRWRAYVKVKTRSTFTFILGLSYIAPVSFTHLTFTCAHTEKLRDSGNKPKHT